MCMARAKVGEAEQRLVNGCSLLLGSLLGSNVQLASCTR